ncbi:MAG TPA: hypothetical protein VK875_06470 [Euzebyales bacterium]|nr:hypothetical protein [Euzebyales bacterium]
MQSCVECGWDTRSGARLCSACRAARAEARSTTSSSDPAAEKEALLTAVLHSARALPPPAAEEHEDTQDADAHGRTVPRDAFAPRAVGPGTVEDDVDEIDLRDDTAFDDAGEHAVEQGESDEERVMLREIDDEERADDHAGASATAAHDHDGYLAWEDPAPAARDAFTTAPPQESFSQPRPQDGRGTDRHDGGASVSHRPRDREHDTADDLAALFNAPDPRDRGDRTPDEPAPPEYGEPPTNGRGAAQPDDLAAMLDAPTPWDRDAQADRDQAAPASPPPDAAPDPAESADGLAAMFNAPSPWDEDRTSAPGRREHDTADDLAELFKRPSPWQRDPAPGQHTTSPPERPAAPGHDTADDLAALFNRPSWDQETQPPPSSDPQARAEPASAEPGHHDEPERRDPPLPDDDELAAYTGISPDYGDMHHTGEAADEAVTSWDAAMRDADTRNATYAAEEWPWLTKSGQSGFWAPPSGDERATPSSPHMAVGHPASSDPADHDAAAAASGELPLPPRSGTDSGPLPGADQPAPAQPDTAADQSLGERLNAWFQELGAWTAVAQVALLAVGMLCIIQVFVLIVVSSYLNDANGNTDQVVAGSLAAHEKVAGVMLPALLGFAIVALAFAAWRGYDRSEDAAGADGLLGRPLGFPVALWRVFIAVLILGVLVLFVEQPATVDAAQRVTQWAMVACTILGAACFTAPRGLEVPFVEPEQPTTTTA